MQSYQTVLLALELNARSDRVLIDRIQKIKGDLPLALHLVHSVDNIMGYGAAYGVAIGVDVEEGLMKEARNQMRAAGKKLGVSEDMQHIEVGAAREVVVKVAETISADLIVVGSHGQHGWHLLLGSTANGVLHEAGCDVLAVRVKK